MNTTFTFNRILLIVIGVVVLINLILLGVFFSRQFLNGRRISSAILELTSPVQAVTGTVAKINDGSVTIEVVTNTIGTEELKSSVDFLITDKTVLSKETVIVPYVFKGQPDTMGLYQPATVADVQVGDTITVTADNDLRIDTGRIVASTIRVVPQDYILNGIVTANNGTSIQVKGMKTKASAGVQSVPPEEKTYRVFVDGETEISGLDTVVQAGATPGFKEYKVEDLKAGTSVTVYFPAEVQGDQVKALLIRPNIMATVQESPASSSATVSTTPRVTQAVATGSAAQ